MTDVNCSTQAEHKSSKFGIPSIDGIYGNPWGSVYQANDCGMVTLSISGGCTIIINLTPEIARKIGIALLWQAKLADLSVQS